ncbi:uncharacterized protein K02A2.6-like [Sycon ciliatum]|uniref:uncharacterized protein K02A2.6-like n=1 Tax=Sycon ciliatum TaxID=27933 RepID=UPI0031F71888
MAKFQPPESFDFSAPENWPRWKSRFTRFQIATKLSSESADVQISTLIYSLGPTADDIFQRELSFAQDSDKDDFDKVVDAFDKYFAPADNVIHERTQFARLRQLPGESVATFSSRLHSVAARCRFDKPSERIRDHLVAHMADSEVSKAMQKKDIGSLTLADVLKEAKAAETLEIQLATQRSAATQPSVAAAVARGHHKQSRGTGRPKNAPAASRQSAPSYSTRGPPATSAPRAPCSGCGSSSGHSRRECPAWSVECRKCQRRGHFAKVCRSSRQVGASEMSDHPVSDSASASASCFMGSASSESQEPSICVLSSVSIPDSTEPWLVELPINGQSVLFKLDSGADCTLLSLPSYNSLSPQPKLTPISTKVTGPDGQPLPIHGAFVAASSWKDRNVTFRVIVVDGPSNLLSRSVCQDLNLLSCDVSEASASPPSAPPVIGRMSGPAATIELQDNAQPYHCQTARRVPIHLQAKVKTELDRMVQMGVISPVTDPTDWCAPMVPVLKKNGSVRICVDLKRLNQSVKRSHFTLPTIEDTLGKLSGAKVFSSLDTASGFWQVPLADDSASLTTFMTPFGRFHFNRLPFGITSAPEVFQRRLLEIVGHIPNVVVFMDDILVFGATLAEHDAALTAVHAALASAGVLLNPAKSRLRMKSLTFLGHLIGADGVRPDPAKVSAIQALKSPTNVPELRRAMGMFTFLSKFVPDMANVSAPLRALLKADTAWQWDTQQETAFCRLKELATTAPCLALFSPDQPVRISADASSYGLGAVLLQPDGSRWRPVAYASRSLSPTEQRYAQIEKECLAIVWACEHFHHYIYGGPQFTVETDHKPLVPLINSADLARSPLRCQRLLMRLMRYNPTAIHVPGKSLVIADTLSRAPQESSPTSDLADEVQLHVSAVTSHCSTDPLLVDVRNATNADADMCRLRALILNGWPAKPTSVPASLRPYFAVRDELSTADGLIFRGQRVIIPASQRNATLASAHEGHQGVGKCRARARAVMWWPGMSTDIESYVMSCATCAKARPNPAEPLISSEFPSLPWSKIACDLCAAKGSTYLVVVDYFSRYIEVKQLTTTTSAAVIACLHSVFSTHGIPHTLVSDNGPQFASASFRAFAAELGFAHRTSSPRFAQSNGAAERAVQTAKQLILKNDDLPSALLAYRSTPLANGYSPSQLLFGRQIRSRLPGPLPAPAWPDLTALADKEASSRSRQADRYNQRHRARLLPVLAPGAPVYVPDMDKTGHVQNRLSERSYTIDLTPGSSVRRNRRHMRALPSTPSASAKRPVPSSSSSSIEPMYEVDYGVPAPVRVALQPPANSTLPPLLPVPQSPRVAKPLPPGRRPPSSRVRHAPQRYAANT